MSIEALNKNNQALEALREIASNLPEAALKPDSFTSGNLIMFDDDGNLLDAGIVPGEGGGDITSEAAGIIEGDAPVVDSGVQEAINAHINDKNNPHNVTMVDVKGSNSNLLINSDFKVWQRGTSFTHNDGTTVQEYLADRWKSVSTFIGTVEKTIDGIKFTSTEVGFINLIQFFETHADLKGKTVTVSAKVKGTAGTKFNIVHHTTDINNILNLKESTFSGDWEVFTFTFNLSTDDIQGINVSARNNCLEYCVAWVKLEVSDVATPYIPRSYEEEMALCSQFNAHTGEFVGHNYSNPNLLINGDF